MPASFSDSDRWLLERAVLAPHELDEAERADVQRLTSAPGPGRRFVAELEAFYGAVEASYTVTPAPSATARRLARRLVPRERGPRAVRLRLRTGDARRPPYVLQASTPAPSRFVPVATLVGDDDDLVVRLVQDASSGACLVYVVAGPERRDHALLAGDAFPDTLVTDARGRVAFACPDRLTVGELDGQIEVHPALCAERVAAAAFAVDMPQRIDAEDGGGEAAVLSHVDGMLRAAPARGRAAFRWLVLQVDGEPPRSLALRDGRGETVWDGASATVWAYA